jgi:PHD/YefM family antitoxin component YafN of YafNO toxin-antitoxin module
MTKQLITEEKFTSIQEAQAGLTRLFKLAARKGNFYRVMKNNRPLGVLIPDNVWESLLEDLEALSSKAFMESIKKARLSKKRYSSNQVKKILDF